MTWGLEWGPQVPKLVRAGVDLERAPFMQNAPDLPEHLEWVYEAFWALSSSRQIGMGIGPIPFEPIDRYADRYHIEDFEEFHHLIRAMDAAFLEHHNRKTGGN